MMNYALRITHYELEQWFQQFNHDYFHDKLPMPRLKLSKSRTRLGSFACRRKLTWRGYQPVDFSIRISTYYQMTERQVQNVLLHEMIHYYIAYMRLRDTSAHGTVFRQLMDELNRNNGLYKDKRVGDNGAAGNKETVRARYEDTRGQILPVCCQSKIRSSFGTTNQACPRYCGTRLDGIF